jgi:hypothetical protein
MPRKAAAQSLTYSKALKISRKDFQECLAYHKEDFVINNNL